MGPVGAAAGWGDWQTNSKRHYDLVVSQIMRGKVIPFFGAGVNRCGRPEGASWERGRYLPESKELAEHLARSFRVPEDQPRDLLRVSQYVALMAGVRDLYDDLHDVLDLDYPPTPLHSFFAKLPGLLRAKGYRACHQVIVTTNYDDVLERAFEAEDEPYDLVSYIAEGPDDRKGKFWHVPPDGEPRLIDVPNEYAGLELDKRSLVVKIHGAVNREADGEDSYVITEDHYIDYLTHTEINELVPASLVARLQNAHFLFLGYSLRDWNLRVILHRIAESQIQSSTSWAIMQDPDVMDRKFWVKRNVDIYDVALEEYLVALDERIRSLANEAPR